MEQAATNAATSADLLLDLLERWPDGADLAEQLVAVEHRGDDLTHQVLTLLHTGSLSAEKRGDFLTLASKLDDVTDLVEETAGLLSLYGIEASMQQAVEMATVLQSAAAKVAEAVGAMSRPDALTTHIQEIHRLENEGDRLVRAAVASLFAGGIDPMIVIRWKDVYERLEHAIDACEQVADVLTAIGLKSQS